MTWHKKAMKDVVSCDKLRGAANRLRSGDVRIRQRILSNVRMYSDESLNKRTRGIETSQYPEEKKIQMDDSLSSGERKGISLNPDYAITCMCCNRGVAGSDRSKMQFTRSLFFF